jgi:hypothetical protein
LNVLPVVQIAEGTAIDVPGEIRVGGLHRRRLPAQTLHTEDLAEKVEILPGCEGEHGLPEVQELPGLHLAELVSDDIAKGARLAAGRELGDTRIREGLQDSDLILGRG